VAENVSIACGDNQCPIFQKATGRIILPCEDGHLIADAIKNTIATGEGDRWI